MQRILHLPAENRDEYAAYRFFQFWGYIILGLDPVSGKPKEA